MSIKPQKSNFTISNITKEASSSPPVVALSTSIEELSEEDQSTLTSLNGSNKFTILNKQSLNPLKPIIVANTEFVPVGTGNTSPDSTGLKAQFGEGNVVNVNNITKLFEIQRQIRNANLKNAQELLRIAKGYDNSKILKEIKNKMYIIFNDIVDEDINKTIENFIAAVGNNLKSKVDSKPRTGSVAKKANLITIPIPTLNVVNEKNKNDPYYKTLIEYAAYEIILYEAIEFLSGILSFKDTALKSWSILESTSFSKLASIDTASLSRAASRFISNSGLKTVDIPIANGSLSKVLDVSTTAETTDIALIMQSFITAYDTILLKNGFHSDMMNNEMSIEKEPRISFRAPVADALMTLKKSWLIGLYQEVADYKSSNNPYTDSKHSQKIKAIVNTQLGKSQVSGLLNENKINSIMNEFPSSMSDSEVYGELLSACLFNDAFDIADHQAIRSDRIFFAMGSQRNNDGGGIKDYYKVLLGNSTHANMTPGSDTEKSDSFVDYDPLTRNHSSQGALNKYFGVKIDGPGDFRYLPFESTQNYPGDDGYLTGPDYFVDVALQRGDQDFKEFNNFTTNYKQVTSNYIHDVDKYLQIFKVEPAFISLCQMIGNDLESQAGNLSNALLRLSILVKLSRSRSGLLKVFKSAYFGNMSKQTGDDPTPLSGKTGDPFIDGDNPGGDLGLEASQRRVSRYKTNSILRDFIDNTLNVADIKDKRDRDFRDLGGNKNPRSLKQKEYTEKDRNFSKISGTKTINSGTGEALSGKREYKINKQSGKEFTSSNKLNKEQYHLDTGIRYGDNSLDNFLDNKHFLNALFGGDEAKQESFNDSRPGLTRGRFANNSSNHKFNNKLPKTINKQGGIYKLSEHHRAFILFSYVAKILQKSLTIKAESGDPKKSNNAFIKLIGSKDELMGIARAFKSVGSDPADAKKLRAEGSGTAAENAAYTNTSAILGATLSSIRRRTSKISQATSIPAIHALQLEKQKNKIKEYINSGDGSKRSMVAISLLKNRKIRAYEDTLALISEESVSEMFSSYVNTFVHKKDTIFTLEDGTDYRQMKLMMKILTNPGYGFLSSEKRGNSVISHVGITNSMLSVLRYDAYKKTGNTAFLESKRFCINIFKRNEIDASEIVYPKTFLFDSKYQIHDCNEIGNTLNHITNYSDTWTFNNIVDNIEFTSWTTGVPKPATKDSGKESDDPFNNLKESYRPKRELGQDMMSRSDVSKDLLINHINDYAIKLYYKYTLGIDLETYSFVLKSSDIDFTKTSGGFSDASQEMFQDYSNLINQIISLYPAANIDQVLASELYRGIKTIGATPVYSLGEKVKRVLLPKKFDRVLSIPFNDKDFILYTPAYDKEFEELFKTYPNFSYTSRISRPDFRLAGQQNLLKILSPVRGKKTNEEKYKDNCEQDFPEIFSTYVTITILPDGEN